jgi:hypothetical protein
MEMGLDFRQHLGAALPEFDHKLIFNARGRKHPPINHLDVVQTFAKFKAEFLPLCPLEDPLGRDIKIESVNFRKLLNLKHRKLGDKARAWKIIEELEQGTFDIANYTLPEDRIRHLFWIPEVITDPDAIYKNSHSVVKADEVFVCVYDKLGSKVKLAFTSTFVMKPTRRVEIVTSYLTDAKTAMKCVEGHPIYLRNK